MILPIISYGHSILRQKCKEIQQNNNELQSLIDNMWETLYPARGCGLAAPQVNQPFQLFIVDSAETYEQMEEEERNELFEGDKGIKETFLNARILEYSDKVWDDKEGCLSIPTLSGEVDRPWSITIEYTDRNFEKHTKTFHGTTARMVQHEYDHTQGVLFIDHMKPLAKRLLSGKLSKIAKGEIQGRYKMRFPK